MREREREREREMPLPPERREREHRDRRALFSKLSQKASALKISERAVKYKTSVYSQKERMPVLNTTSISAVSVQIHSTAPVNPRHECSLQSERSYLHGFSRWFCVHRSLTVCPNASLGQPYLQLSVSENKCFTEMRSGSEVGSYVRLIDVCITQL